MILETDPATARAIARGHMAMYLGLPNYANNLRSLGFGDDDLADGGSDRLVDAIVAWGDIDAIRARVRAHHDAGADHVCIQVLPPRSAGAADAGMARAGAGAARWMTPRLAPAALTTTIAPWPCFRP